MMILYAFFTYLFSGYLLTGTVVNGDDIAGPKTKPSPTFLNLHNNNKQIMTLKIKAALNCCYSFSNNEKSIEIKYGSLKYNLNAEQDRNKFLTFIN